MEEEEDDDDDDTFEAKNLEEVEYENEDSGKYVKKGEKGIL